jgi:hypothetical protein
MFLRIEINKTFIIIIKSLFISKKILKIIIIYLVIKLFLSIYLNNTLIN